MCNKYSLTKFFIFKFIKKERAKNHNNNNNNIKKNERITNYTNNEIKLAVVISDFFIKRKRKQKEFLIYDIE